MLTVTSVVPGIPVITSPGSAGGVRGRPFSCQITASDSPTSFGAAAGLPNGLSVNSTTGLIAGTPTEIGSFDVAISARNALGTGSANLTITIANPPPALLDVDDDGRSDALSDGLLILRYLFGLTGDPLISGAVGLNAKRTTSAAIADYLLQSRPLLDIDGNGSADALTDGLLMLRYLFGLRGPPLIAGAIGPMPTRSKSPEIEAYLAGMVVQ